MERRGAAALSAIASRAFGTNTNCSHCANAIGPRERLREAQRFRRQGLRLPPADLPQLGFDRIDVAGQRRSPWLCRDCPGIAPRSFVNQFIRTFFQKRAQVGNTGARAGSFRGRHPGRVRRRQRLALELQGSAPRSRPSSGARSLDDVRPARRALVVAVFAGAATGGRRRSHALAWPRALLRGQFAVEQRGRDECRQVHEQQEAEHDPRPASGSRRRP